MAQLSKQELLEEAKKQSEMLERISRWRTYSLVLSVGVTGIVIIVAGMAFSIFCNFGIRTGRENVERILRAAENSK